jgi:hypothetical protein
LSDRDRRVVMLLVYLAVAAGCAALAELFYLTVRLFT